VLDCLGTAFFVKEDGLLMSAKHVLAVAPGPDEAIVALPMAVQPPTYHLLRDLSVSEHFDIATVWIAEKPERIEVLPIADADAPLNLDILTMEFSGTVVTPDLAHINPYHRKGHVICRYPSNFPEPTPTNVLDLSFPALKGSSGAPLVVEGEWTVTGMIVANVERHLLPAQVERIESKDGAVEERRYFLPTGKAISWSHLREFLAGL